jgi:hypothetical protein
MKKITMAGIFAFLKGKGYETKEAREGMTQEEFVTMSADFTTEFGKDFATAMAEATTLAQDETDRVALLAKINTVFPKEPKAPVTEGEGTPAPKPEATTIDQITVMAGVDKLVELVNAQKAQIELLSKETENPNPKKVNAKIIAINSGASNAKYLFGIEAPMFLREKPWNQVAATKMTLAILGANGNTGLSSNWNEYEEAFRADVKVYGKSLANRICQLQNENGLVNLKLAEMDFTGFDNTGWGESYIVRRQDALISYLRTLPSVTSIFSVRYGVQDKEEVTNSFMTDFSQAWQTGRVLKGGHSVAPMLAEVFDVMMKFKFENMKKLEREYIGYLNRENSFPIKWSMVEWMMAETLKKLLNEQNERRINGRRVEPTVGVAGHHLFGSNGVIAQLTKYVTDGYLTREADLNTYTPSTMYAYVDTFVERINQLLPSLAGYTLYINAKHIPWYLKAYEAANGTKLDYNGAKLEIKNYSLDAIVGIPNMGNSCLMFITIPGNIEFLENAAGEMAAFYFQQDLDELLTMAVWKEGTTAYMVGRKNGTKKDQFIFLNDPFTALIAGATTADASVNNTFKTIANAGATALTDFVGASEGVVYKLICGATANATTVAKAAKFADLTAAWVPTAVNDFLEVTWNATTSKFVEVARKIS